MDSFFLPLVTAALAEWGDKTQIFAMLLAMRFGKPMTVLAAVACAAALNAGISAFAGSLIAPMIDHRASQLFLALGFLFAAAGAFWPFKDPKTDIARPAGIFIACFLAFAVLEFGDKTQFLAAGYATLFGTWVFVAVGVAIGVVIGCAPAIMMGETFRDTVPLKLVRRAIGAVWLLVASILAINAFLLI